MLFHRIVMEPATLNRYAYVEGNPITNVNPSGYSSQPGSVGAILNSVGYNTRIEYLQQNLQKEWEIQDLYSIWIDAQS